MSTRPSDTRERGMPHRDAPSRSPSLNPRPGTGSRGYCHAESELLSQRSRRAGKSIRRRSPVLIRECPPAPARPSIIGTHSNPGALFCKPSGCQTFYLDRNCVLFDSHSKMRGSLRGCTCLCGTRSDIKKLEARRLLPKVMRHTFPLASPGAMKGSVDEGCLPPFRRPDCSR